MRIRHLAPLLLALATLSALGQERAPAQPPPGASAQPGAPAQPSPGASAQPGAPPATVGPATPAGPPQSFIVYPGPPTVALEPLLQRIGRAANKKFLVASYIPPQIYLGGVDAGDVTYPLLLSILRANALAVVDIEGRLNVIPESQVRNYPVPFASNDDNNIPADEWRTRLLQLTNVEAAQIVPIVRPLLPPSAHLAAFPPSNQLVIVDRYANLKRITEIVRALDKPPAR